MNEYVLELTPQALFLTTLIWYGAAAGKVKVRSVPVPAVLAAHEEAVGEPGEGVRVVGVVRVEKILTMERSMRGLTPLIYRNNVCIGPGRMLHFWTALWHT
jgi:hypothetical protein